MRKRFTGHIGDASWAEATRFIDSGGRGTLFILLIEEGDPPRIAEKALHFGASDVVRLTQGSDPGRLEQEVSEIESRPGEPFDFIEGVLPPGLETRPGVARFPRPGASTSGGVAGSQATPSGRAAPPSRDPRAVLEALSGAAAALQVAGHLAHLQLASAWRALGSPHRASGHLREAGASLEAWGAPEAALKCFEESLSICPGDVLSAERLLSLLQGAGKRDEAEQLAERISSSIEGWHEHELLVRLCGILDSAPKSETLRRSHAEAMIRAGEGPRGIQELATLASALEDRGDREAARRLNERILQLDPTNARAAGKLRGSRRVAAVREQLGRWGTIALAILLAGIWMLWDGKSASAFEKKGAPSRDLRIAMEELRAEAARYPLSRHASRLAAREEELCRQAFVEEKRILLEALAAQGAGDTGTAYHLFGKLAKSGIITPFVERAEVGRREISRLDARRQALLQQGMKLAEAGDSDAAFRTFIEVLRGADRALNASHYVVPLCIETVPPGALIEIDGAAAGKTPRCVGAPSDPAARIRLTLAGFEPAEIADPVGQAMAAGSGRLSRVLSPQTAWMTKSYGGVLAGGAGTPDGSVIILGADGVLRAIDSRGSPRWEVPLDGRVAPAGSPIVAGPCAVLGTRNGKVLGFSLSSGKVLWTASLASSGDVRLGPMVEGQISVTCGRFAALLSPRIGLVSKRFPGSSDAVGFSAWEGSREGALVCADGKLHRVSLRTGAPDLARELSAEPVIAIARSGETWAALGSRGGLVGYGPRGEKLWAVKVPPSSTLLRGAGPSRIVVGSPDGSLLGLDAPSGTPVWKTSLEGRLLWISEPADEEVIVATVDRDPGEPGAVALHARGGLVLWEISLSAGEAATARLQGQKLLVSSPGIGIKAIPVR